MSQNELAPPVSERSDVLSRPAAGSLLVGRSRALQALWERWSWTTFPALLFIYTRGALLGFSYFAMRLAPNLNWSFDPREFLIKYPALDGLCRWDCWHFGRIAREGYTEARWTNFFPLYPLLTRTVYQVTGMPVNLALLVVSNAAGFGSFLVIYRIFTMVAEEDAARCALALFAAYPFAFFQAAGYPESLMIVSSALAILLARRGNHLSAGIALGFGVLARHLTLFAGAALLAAQIRQRGLHPKRLLLNPAILGLLIPWLALALYSFYQYKTFGNPLAFAAARDKPPWGPMAWWGIQDLLKTRLDNDQVRAMYSYIPFGLMITAGALGLLMRRQWSELAAFAIIFMMMIWAIGMWGLGRYSASVWPAFLPLGVWLARRPKWQGPVIGILALFQGLFFYLYAHMFAIL